MILIQKIVHAMIKKCVLIITINKYESEIYFIYSIKEKIPKNHLNLDQIEMLTTNNISNCTL